MKTNFRRYGEVSDGKRYHAILEQDGGSYYLASEVDAAISQLEANIGGGDTAIAHLNQENDHLRDECDRLRAGLEMIAQVRHVDGSAQAAFRSNLKLADAVLAGKDVRSLEVVEEIFK